VLVNGDPHPNRPDLPSYGAGEAACRPMFAAVANAIYDATGVRIRRVPFRDNRVLAALKVAQGVTFVTWITENLSAVHLCARTRREATASVDLAIGLPIG
jgi:hypothetical protein